MSAKWQAHNRHKTFNDQCHFCWADFLDQVREPRFLGRDAAHPTFTCDRCGKEGCTDGGVYMSVNLCLRCYKRLHRLHREPVPVCEMCMEAQFWRNKG